MDAPEKKRRGAIAASLSFSRSKGAFKLKREGQARPRHAEVVMGTFYDVPAEISHNTDVGRDSDLQTAAELAGKAAFIFGGGESDLPLLIKSNSVGLVIDTSKDTTYTAPNIGRETRTVYGITQRERG